MDHEQLKKASNGAARATIESLILEKVNNIQASSLVKAKDYKPNSNVQKDYRDSIEDDARRQQIRHRDSLLKIVSRLATWSFALLAIVVLVQMILRWYRPDYNGVSDSVVQIIAVSVFGQVLTVMGGLSYQLWKKNQ